MKRLIAASLVAAALASGNTQAGNTSGQFNVSITLTSACTVSAINDVAFAYTSLGGAASATGGDFTVTCTDSLPYTFGLQAGTGAATPPGAASISVTDNAVNLAYTLSAPAGATGNGTAQTYNVTGTMAANQAGTCGGASCTNAAATNKRQTLIVNY